MKLNKFFLIPPCTAISRDRKKALLLRDLPVSRADWPQKKRLRDLFLRLLSLDASSKAHATDSRPSPPATRSHSVYPGLHLRQGIKDNSKLYLNPAPYIFIVYVKFNAPHLNCVTHRDQASSRNLITKLYK